MSESNEPRLPSDKLQAVADREGAPIQHIANYDTGAEGSHGAHLYRVGHLGYVMETDIGGVYWQKNDPIRFAERADEHGWLQYLE